MLAKITALLLIYRYWAIFPFALFEAPLMSIVIGFFAATGHLQLLPAFGIVVAGDFIGDTALYVFGRSGRSAFTKLGARLGLSPAKAKMMADIYLRRDLRAIVVSKLVHGVGFTGLIVAGSLRIPYLRFIAMCIVVTILQSALLAAIDAFGRRLSVLCSYLGYFDRGRCGSGDRRFCLLPVVHAQAGRRQ